MTARALIAALLYTCTHGPVGVSTAAHSPGPALICEYRGWAVAPLADAEGGVRYGDWRGQAVCRWEQTEIR